MCRDTLGESPLRPWKPTPIREYAALRAKFIRAYMNASCIGRSSYRSIPKAVVTSYGHERSWS